MFIVSCSATRSSLTHTGGYGGYPPVAPYESKYDGFVSRPDTWETYDGQNWRQLNWNNTFGGRAWMGACVTTKLYLFVLSLFSLIDVDYSVP